MARPREDHQENPELAAFGKAVRLVRLEKDISQEALAEMAEIDRSYMGGIERGEHNVSLININKIASALQISLG